MNPSKLPIGFVAGICLLLSCADYNLYDESIKPTPVALRITAVADSSVTLAWSQYKVSADLFKNYRVYFGHSAGLDTSDSLADTMSFITDTVTRVRRLAPGNLYFFRVIVTTKQGGKGASNVVDTVTLANGASNLTLFAPDSTVITDSTVRLHWSACTGVFDGYKIRMDTTEKVDKADSVIKTLYSDTAVTIPNLIQGKTYSFRVYAFRDTAIAAASNVMTVRTTSTKVNQQVLLSVLNVTDSSVALNWNMYRGNDFKKYELRCSHNYSVSRTDSLVDTFTIQADTVFEVRQLKSSTHYSFKIFVPNANSANGYLYSNEIDTVTKENKKGIITFYTPDSASVTDSSIMLRWTKYALASVYSYKIYMDTNLIVDKNSRLVKITSDTLATIKGLIASTSYGFRAFAMGDTGAIAMTQGEPLRVQTLSCDKSWDKTLMVTDTADSSITLRWSQYQCNDFASYVVRQSKDTSTVGPTADTIKTVSILSDTVTLIRGLTPATSYAFRVFVKTTTGQQLNAQPSGKVAVTTKSIR